jgi:hypothetical protein
MFNALLRGDASDKRMFNKRHYKARGLESLAQVF